MPLLPVSFSQPKPRPANESTNAATRDFYLPGFMKHRQRGFSFRGFVALADLIFAVSAGLLLLNPVQFEDVPSPEELAAADPVAMKAEMEQMEQAIPELEEQLAQLEKRTGEILKETIK